MLTRTTILILAMAAAALGAPAVQRDNTQVVLDVQVPEQAPEQAMTSGEGHNIIINVFENPDVEPMCRPNGTRCRLNASCCSGYCSWHQGYKCADRSSLEEEEMSSLENPDVEPMCRPNGTRCRLNSSCCSGYCSWHQGYKCADRSHLEEEI